MRVVAIETAGLRALPDGAYAIERDRGGPSHLTIVTGPQSAGLTTFLDAVSYSAGVLGVDAGMPSSDAAIRAGAGLATIRTRWALDPDERAAGGVEVAALDAEVVFQRGALGSGDADPALLGLMTRYDHQRETSKVVVIPARRVVDGVFPAFSDFEMDQRLKHLSSSPDKFVGLPYALAKHALGLGERARFDEVQRLFDELAGGTQLVGIDRTGQPEFALRSAARVSLRDLGFAERNAFVFAAAPVLMGLARSVVLVDTPEMGLAPGLAARWIDVLRGHAPDAQWIVATRDPALVERAEPAARIRLEGRPA